MKKNVAIIMGGYSSEYNISIKSGEVVYKTLKKDKKLNLFRIIITKEKWYHIDNYNKKYEVDKRTFQIIKENNCIKFDLVFNTIHGIPGENGEIQSYLNSLNIKQTSSNSAEASLTFNKSKCKNAVEKFGVNVPKSIVINKNDSIDTDNILSKLKIPLFIKPNKGGSSFGISRVTKQKNIIKALNNCFKEDNEALIEEEIVGREISVGVIKYQNKIIALPPTEIISHNTFFDFNAKYKGESDEITPAKLDKNEEKNVKKTAIDIYMKLKLNGFSRSDFILKNGKFYFLEINTNPGLTNESILPQQAQAANISLNELFNSIIE